MSRPSGALLGSITVDRYDPATEETHEETWYVYGSATKPVAATFHSPAEGGLEELVDVENEDGVVMTVQEFCSTVLIDDGESHPSYDWIIKEIEEQLTKRR